MRRITAVLLGVAMILGLSACGGNSPGAEQATAASEKGSVTIFAAKSLNGVVDELIAAYREENPDVEITANYDSSGTLMEQIKEGAECDIFFSAAQKQMDTLEEAGLVVAGTRKNVVNNQVCLVTYQDSGTRVTGLADLEKASSIALADGSVPVGKYTRQALVNAGLLPPAEDPSLITTREVSDALGGIEINECANVGAVTAAVSEGSNEVGTVYRSDTYGLEDRLEILEVVSYDLTGNVIYPITRISNGQTEEDRDVLVRDFLSFLTSDAAKPYYEKYYMDTNVE